MVGGHDRQIPAGAVVTWLVLHHWYRYHALKFRKWEHRKWRIKEKQGTKIFRQRYVLKVWAKYEHHRFWLHNYCELMSAYGHEIDCIHFGEGENTSQSGRCPYKEDECKNCDGRIELRQGVWEHYLTYMDDGFTLRSDTPEPKLAHWPVFHGKPVRR